MKIERFEYHDKANGWELEETEFSNLTLLVGVSGAGKTKILDSLLNLKKIAGGESIEGAEWDAHFFLDDGTPVHWAGSFGKAEQEYEEPVILCEVLEADGKLLVEREGNGLKYRSHKIPKLSSEESALKLIAEDDVRRVQQAIFKIVQEEPIIKEKGKGGSYSIPEALLEMKADIETIRHTELPLPLKLAVFHIQHKDRLEEIKSSFMRIFSSVEDIEVELPRSPKWPDSRLVLIKIKEKAVAPWIAVDELSSGMQRTLAYLAWLHACPPDSVYLIDEFENGLGFNCLDEVTGIVNRRSIESQFIITSHHPYVINNIDPGHWKIVTRQGGTVRTRDASELGIGRSRHEAYIQLINSEEYEEGIAAG